MLWEVVALGIAVLAITGIAIWSMKISRKGSEFASFGSTSPIDNDILAAKIAEAIGAEMRQVLKEFTEELKTLPMASSARRSYNTSATGQPGEISMDESIIPTTQAIEVEATNLDTAAKEEKVVDKALRESKSKLAGIFKNRKKE